MFSLLIAMRLGLATPPATSPNHGGDGPFQVSARKRNARVFDFLAAFALALLLVSSYGEAAPQYLVALNGYDAVGYYTQAEALPGRNEYAFFWSGATWLFSSEANRDAFAANENSAPRYDGYCAYVASQATRLPARLSPGASWMANSMSTSANEPWSCGWKTMPVISPLATGIGRNSTPTEN